MTAYWVMYLVPLVTALLPFRAAPDLRQTGWRVIGIVFTLLIGLRHEVGADWIPYLGHYEAAIGEEFIERIFAPDPGYAVLNWLSAYVAMGVYGVNLICGAVIMAGVISLSRQQPLPWLAFAISVPYLLVVVSMGYTRQAAALGFVLWALSELQRLRTWRFAMLILAAALFHKTAVLLLPLALFTPGMGRIRTFIGVSLLFALAAGLLLVEHFDYLWTTYVEELMHSEGGAIRVWMNFIPALMFLWFWKRWRARFGDHWLWTWFAVLSIVCVPLVGIASTAVDRVALYLTPIQLVVLSRLPALIGEPALRGAAVVTILGTYGLVLWVWLNYAIHAFAWVPYNNVLFQ